MDNDRKKQNRQYVQMFQVSSFQKRKIPVGDLIKAGETVASGTFFFNVRKIRRNSTFRGGTLYFRIAFPLFPSDIERHGLRSDYHRKRFLMTKKKILQQLIIASLCTAFLSAVPAAAQTQEPARHPWWVNMGGGLGSVGGVLTMTAGFEYSQQFGSMLLSGRLLGSTNKNPTILDHSPSDVVYKMAEYAVLYGPVCQCGNHSFSAGAGIGLMRAIYENRDEITTGTNSVVSLPLEAQWCWRPTNFVGCGFYTYASLNFEKNFYGLWFFARLGLW
jgi:hypothetical protein